MRSTDMFSAAAILALDLFKIVRMFSSTQTFYRTGARPAEAESRRCALVHSPLRIPYPCPVASRSQPWSAPRGISSGCQRPNR